MLLMPLIKDEEQTIKILPEAFQMILPCKTSKGQS